MDPRAALPLTDGGLDRVEPRRDDETWLAQRWADPGTRVLHVAGGRVEVDRSEAGEPERAAVRLVTVAPYATDAVRVLLGVDGEDRAWFAVVGARPGTDPADRDRWSGLRELGAELAAGDAAIVTQALGLGNWHEAHPRCPRCGEPTEVVAAGHARRCPTDGSLHHPRTDPAVIMLVVDEVDRALLGRHSRWQVPVFSTLAGFVEPGESAEAAVAREVSEEAGVRVDRVAYVASQPWPFPSSLMLGFRAWAAGTRPEPDGVELAEARWFARDELAAAVADGEVILPPRLSISRRLIEDWFGGPVGD